MSHQSRLSPAILLVTMTLLLLVSAVGTGQPSAQMTAHFINVGQAHATLLEFQCGAMLVDIGSQDDDHTAALTAYLTAFFARRTDLSNTLESILITHNHIDHTRALRPVIEGGVTVRRFIDNGFRTGSGTSQTNWLRNEVESGALQIEVLEITDAAVEAVTPPTGLTNATIDPFACEGTDPRIRVLQGRFDENPGWPEGEFENQNNHSLVTRVDFGSASFLFMGDLEEVGIELLTDFYGSGANSVLNADVIQVGHHGSHNATTDDLLEAVTPKVALIPVGEWTFGQDGGTFTTFAFGHPRQTTTSLLAQHMTRKRSQAKSVKVAEKAKKFVTNTVSKAIYATGWDGTVRVVAEPNGGLTVFREN
jgi:competence protein ComEC